MDEQLKIIVTILLFFCLKVNAQYTAHWKSSDHATYEVQQGLDTFNFITIATVPALLNDTAFTATVPGPTYCYRIVADRDTSKNILVYDVVAINYDSIYRPVPKPTQLIVKIINVGNQFRVNIESPHDEYCKIVVYDMVGRQLSATEAYINKGLNAIYINQPPSHGLYIIRFETAYEIIVKKVVK